MIVYSPINGEVLSSAIQFHPKHAFIMTQLAEPMSQELSKISTALEVELASLGFDWIDATSLMTGKDFLDKIWKIILGVPLGIAIVTPDMSQKTIANIFYELGIMDALGKETLIIKSKSYKIPSDFKRTEYLNYDTAFKSRFKQFGENLLKREEHYWLMSEILEADPVLSIDYIKRAYLLNPKIRYKKEAEKIFNQNIHAIDKQSKIHIKNFIKA
jgi:hypothetical protein